MGKYFGTDGVRGRANSRLTPHFAFLLGRAAAQTLVENAADGKKPVMLIGKDTRSSGDMLEAALAAGICSVGVDVLSLGVIPTPGVAMLCRELHAAAGAVISASHNPYYDNGIKFFAGSGYKLPDAVEDRIEALIDDESQIMLAEPHQLGQVRRLEGAVEFYRDCLLRTQKPDLSGLKVVIDCANGAAYQLAPLLLQDLGAELIVMTNEPDGCNINLACGSTHPEKLVAKVLEVGADIGLAFDGDADRLLTVDEQGNILDGDFVLAMAAAELKKQGRLKENLLIVTQMSNMGLRQAMEAIGVEVAETKVGDRYVLEKMLESGAVIGGEQSGHLIFREYNTTGDGAAAALFVLDMLKKSGKKYSELAKVMTRLPQHLLNVPVQRKEGWQDDAEIMAAIEAGRAELNGCGRIVVRTSGTESLLRVMAEGPEMAQLEKIVADIAAVIKRKQG
ncbi:MAG: phosphoglucosamine mutase [Firmicutes bacterium]|nr:phosphoglucosamine mutase [Bacillota bacterium]MBQ6841707.1 phosphoglucosamine mutase [Bacillota bacterium]